MERLSRREIAALLRFVRDLHVRRDREGFVSYLLHALPGVIPSEVVSFNEADPVARSSRTWMSPAQELTSARTQLWNQLMHEHPYVAYQQRSSDPRPVLLSDLAPPRHFARAAIYNELLEPMGIERQLLMGLPSGRSPVRGAGLYRHRRDFSDRDRLLLTLLHPHILQADRNVDWVTRTLDDLRMLERGVEELRQGLIVLNSEATVRLATTQARKWLRAYFPGRAPGSGRLPDMLEQWVLQQIKRLDESDVGSSPHHTLTVEGVGARLVVRLVADQEGPLIFLYEQRPGATSRSLGPLGLSPRETEVLTWVTEGKTNPEIAVILALSPRTVQTHLERIFFKLGVETRTAAAAAALRGAGDE